MSKRPVRCARLIAIVTGLLAAALVTTPQATAEDASSLGAGPAQPTAAATTAAAAAAVRAADVGGTAWYSDPVTGRLVVTADSTVGAGQLARIKAAVRNAVRNPAAALEIRRIPGRFAERTAGGDPIDGPDGWTCTVGFNVQDGSGTKYALVAGHCATVGGFWSIGPVVDSSFPGNDYGLIQYTDQNQAEHGVRGPGGTLITITSAGQPFVGQQVCGAGDTTGVHCGTVTALDVTVNYGDLVVDNLIDTTLCSESGDSGGPLYSGSTAIGIASAGSGDCTSGGDTLYQPVVEPLNAYGVTIW